MAPPLSPRHQEPKYVVQPALPPAAELRWMLRASRGGLETVDDAGLARIWHALPLEEQQRLLAALALGRGEGT